MRTDSIERDESSEAYKPRLIHYTRGSIEVLSGHAGRRKLVQVTGITTAQAESALRLGGE